MMRSCAIPALFSDHRDQLFGNVYVSSRSVKHQLKTSVSWYVVKEIHEWHHIIPGDIGLAAGDVADEPVAGSLLNLPDNRLPLIAGRIARLKQWCSGVPRSAIRFRAGFIEHGGPTVTYTLRMVHFAPLRLPAAHRIRPFRSTKWQRRCGVMSSMLGRIDIGFRESILQKGSRPLSRFTTNR